MNELAQTYGMCPICEQASVFKAYGEWLRDFYACTRCGSLPRERAIMKIIQEIVPDYRSKIIHESSPAPRAASLKLKNNCPSYIGSQFFLDKPLGSIVEGVRCENLEALTFETSSIDLHISQDVFEHILNPDRAFREISRTLRPGGLHIFTVPLVKKHLPSERRTIQTNDGMTYIKPQEFHGNPIGDGRSLVVTDWGTDICRFIFDCSGDFSFIYSIHSQHEAILGEFTDVIVTIKT